LFWLEMEEEDGDEDGVVVVVVVGMEEEMEGRMVEEMVVKLVEEMEMVGGGDGRPKGSWVAAFAVGACWKMKKGRE